MHELSLSRAIVATVLEHAGEQTVSVVNLRVGRLRQVVPESLEFWFGFAARGTVCEGARLEQEPVPAIVRCGDCGGEWELELPRFRCPDCGGAGDVVSGDEFEIESIEVEEAECTAPR